jgi:hypothetical protein
MEIMEEKSAAKKANRSGSIKQKRSRGNKGDYFDAARRRLRM